MDVGAWLRGLGLGRYEQAFRDNEIDAEVLPRLTVNDLKDVGVTAVGHRRRLLDAIEALRVGAGPDAPSPTVSAPATQAERRQLTVLFCDLVGSTALSGRLDPEETDELLRAHQSAVAGEVARFEGHVAKFMGDGVLAYFGWPQAHEDEAERAVRAGLAAVAAVSRLTTPAGEPLAARVGIATGLVVVGGLVGEGSARERTVAGETPNLAARLQDLAQPGTVLIAASTRRLIGTRFKLEDLGPRSIKGFAEEVRVWRLVDERRISSRFEARASGLLPLVGREQEVALLLDRWRQARDGEGQVVLLAGEPGIGKSHIARALGQCLAGEPHVALWYQCSPYYVDTALHPVIEHLEQAAGFQRDDPPATRLDKLEDLLARGTDRAGEAAPLIAALLSVPPEGRYSPFTAGPQQQREATIDLLVEQVAGLAHRRPVLSVFEDLHWADPTTLELLDRLVARIPGERVLLLLTFRPEFPPPWRGRPHATLVSLNRLPRRQSAALVGAVAGGVALPAAILQQIIARADGVPLFLEELTKTVLEAANEPLEPHADRRGPAGSLTPPIPATLQDSLMARLDRLAGAKEVAQIGAVVGREFGYELLAAITPLAEGEFRVALQQLVASELVFVRGTPPTSTYTFKHALVQDAAYSSLLRSRRQQLHAGIARELEGRWPEVKAARPELLAHHFAEAGLPDKAAVYGLEAGRAAFRRSAVTEAVVHLRRALGLLTRVADDDRHQLELDLQVALGHALIAANGYGVPAVHDAFARARELATAADTALQVSLLSGIGAYHYMRSESRAALRVGRDILRLSRRGADPATYVEAQRRIGGALQQLGRLVPAQRHFDRGLARFAPAQEPVRERAFTVEPYSTLLAHLFPNLLLLGYPDRAQTRRTEAFELARRAAHRLTLAQNLHLAAFSAFVLRDHVGLQAWVDEYVALTAEHTLAHFTEWARIWRGWLAAEAGGGAESLSQLQEALAAARATGARYWSPFYMALLADAHRRVADGDQALEVLREALEEVELTDQRVYEAELHRLRATVLLSRTPSSTSEAETCLRRALAVARGQKTRLWELRAATDLARLQQAQGKPREARTLLEPVHAWFTEGFGTPDLEEAAALLDELR